MKKVEIILLALIMVLGFVVRLYKIENPIADWHSWRQADTAAVTRNFVKYGVNMFVPRYDDFSDASQKGLINTSGFRMVEFPIFNIIHFTFFRLFPMESLEFWGRMTAIVSWMVASITLYTIVKRHAGRQTGLLSAALFLFFPYSIYFSRIILPDQLMVAMSMITLNFFDLWVNKQKIGLFILTTLFGAMAILVKPVAVFLLIPMVFQAVRRIKDIRIYIMGIAMVLPFLIWRDWIAKFPEGVPAFKWLLNGNGIRFKPAFFRWMFGERIAILILGKWGVIPLFFGILSAVEIPYLLTWFLGAITFVVVFATGNIQHDYYQIMLMPALSIIVALGIKRLWQPETNWNVTIVKRGLLVISLIFMLAFSWYDVKGDYQVNHWEIVHAGSAVQRLTHQNAVVVAAYMGDSAFLYQTDRRGFTLLAAPIQKLQDLYGVSYYISTTYDNDTNQIMKDYTVVEETPEYVVVRLTK